MNHFVTLDQSDKKFFSYLTGQFSSTLRAIPVGSFQTETQRERVTFHILSKEVLELPHFFKVFLTLIRWEWVLMFLSSFFILLAEAHFLSKPIFIMESFLALLASFFFCSSGFLLNDYYDHINGRDRVASTGGTRAISKGWWPAWKVHRMGLGFCFLGILLGSYFLLLHPSVFYLITLPVGLGVLSFSSSVFRKRGWSELVIFIGLGPCLIYGLSFAITGELSSQFLGLSLLYGWLSCFLLQLRNWQNMMTDRKMKQKTFLSELGFEYSKVFLLIYLSLTPVFLFFAFQNSLGLWKVFLLSSLSLLLTLDFAKKIKRIQGILSHYLFSIDKSFFYYHITLTGLVFVFQLGWL